MHVVIGLEVHVQLLTSTKLFCGCSTQFGLPPNTATCPVCCGLPGTLPVMNEHAFQLAMKAALALNCSIARYTKWDRKNYFYPDLPKNYQISQYDLPFSYEGWLDIETSTGSKKVGILRAHLEEDAGKMLHDEAGAGGDSLVDLNRTGTPLLEIVSHPEMETAEQARAYLEKIRELLRGIEVSDCEMQEGSLRCDANVNVHVPQVDGTFVATPIVEIKNLNSIRNVERAIAYEIDRQINELKENVGKEWRIDESKTSTFGDRKVRRLESKNKEGAWVPVSKTTAGFDDRFGRTEIQRRKEEASDYRYFPDPDLVPAIVTEEHIARVKGELGELPEHQLARLQSQYGLSEYDADILVRNGRAFVSFFEAAAEVCSDAKEAANWATNDVLSSLKARNETVVEFPITGHKLGEFLAEIKKRKLNKQRAREVFAEMLESGSHAVAAIEKLGIKSVADEGQLLEMVQRAIAANAKAVADFKKGKVKAADAIKGFVMRETKGQADTEVLQRLVLEELAKAP